MDAPTESLVDECKRQEESCLYTSTALFEWLKYLRCWKIFFVISPIILAALATALPAEADTWPGRFAAACTVLAGLAMAIYKALDLDVSLDLVAKQANQFKLLQDRFRQAWRVGALGDPAKFQAEFDARIGQMDALRSSSFPPPERFFKRAQTKVESGAYSFKVDSTPRCRDRTAPASRGPAAPTSAAAPAESDPDAGSAAP